MRNRVPFSKPRYRFYGNVEAAQRHAGDGKLLMYQVRLFCDSAQVPVYSLRRELPDGTVIQAAQFGAQEIVTIWGADVAGASPGKSTKTGSRIFYTIGVGFGEDRSVFPEEKYSFSPVRSIHGPFPSIEDNICSVKIGTAPYGVMEKTKSGEIKANFDMYSARRINNGRWLFRIFPTSPPHHSGAMAVSECVIIGAELFGDTVKSINIKFEYTATHSGPFNLGPGYPGILSQSWSGKTLIASWAVNTGDISAYHGSESVLVEISLDFDSGSAEYKILFPRRKIKQELDLLRQKAIAYDIGSLSEYEVYPVHVSDNLQIFDFIQTASNYSNFRLIDRALDKAWPTDVLTLEEEDEQIVTAWFAQDSETPCFVKTKRVRRITGSVKTEIAHTFGTMLPRSYRHISRRVGGEWQIEYEPLDSGGKSGVEYTVVETGTQNFIEYTEFLFNDDVVRRITGIQGSRTAKRTKKLSSVATVTPVHTKTMAYHLAFSSIYGDGGSNDDIAIIKKEYSDTRTSEAAQICEHPRTSSSVEGMWEYVNESTYVNSVPPFIIIDEERTHTITRESHTTGVPPSYSASFLTGAASDLSTQGGIFDYLNHPFFYTTQGKETVVLSVESPSDGGFVKHCAVNAHTQWSGSTLAASVKRTFFVCPDGVISNKIEDGLKIYCPITKRVSDYTSRGMNCGFFDVDTKEIDDETNRVLMEELQRCESVVNSKFHEMYP